MCCRKSGIFKNRISVSMNRLEPHKVQKYPGFRWSILHQNMYEHNWLQLVYSLSAANAKNRPKNDPNKYTIYPRNIYRALT